MMEFNLTTLASFQQEGFMYILYTPKGDHGVIHPMKEELPESTITSLWAYQPSIIEREVIEMAQGVDDFRFLVSQDSPEQK